jgi:AcrR family transcriptional regulator
MPKARAPLRRTREQDLVAATRALFDERGFRDAPVEEIAQAAGIARGLIYRQFASKEELFVLTVTDYLADLDHELAEAAGDGDDPIEALERIAHAYAGFCQRYPAFLDSSLSLMHRPARELQEEIPEWIWLRLGQGMASCIGRLAAILRAGSERGVFAVADPDYTANVLWTQTLGAMHLARIGVGMRDSGGTPELFRITPEEVVQSCVSSALATVGARRTPS